MEELGKILSLIIRVKGVPLNYVIQKIKADNFDATLPYEEAIIQSVKLTGNELQIYYRTVHHLILENVHEESDSYTNIKSFLCRRNGIRDIIKLINI